MEAHGLPAVLIWAQFVPGAQRCGWQRQEALGSQGHLLPQVYRSQRGTVSGVERGLWFAQGLFWG